MHLVVKWCMGWQFLWAVLGVVHGAPVSADSDSEQVDGGNGGVNLGPGAALVFLRKFGYLEPLGTNESETLYSEDRVTDAIRNMQRFGAVPITGKLDPETIKLLTKKRCGVPDIISPESSELRRRKRFVLGSNGWNKRKLSYRLENWAPQLRQEDVYADLEKVMRIWGDYARLTFINKTDPIHDQVDIVISFGSGYHGDRFPFDGEGGTLAHAFFPQNSPGLSGDIHFDLDENWYHHERVGKVPKNKRGVVSFRDVALHELGHSLGLAHSAAQDSVMFPYYQAPSDGDPVLGQDDILALYHLYVTRSIPDGDDEDVSTPRSPITTKRTWTTTTTTNEPSTSTTTSPKPTNTYTTKRGDSNQDLCQGDYDSIAFIRNELFVFRGEYMWRWTDKGQLAGGAYPAHTARLFPSLDGVKKVDAAFERESDGAIIFISGGNYWVFDSSNQRISSDGPRPLSDFGLPHDGVDAAFVWGKNHKTYFFKGDRYWKFNETLGSVKGDSNYPASISDRWRGIPSRITSVITYKDGKTYFFKGQEFWRFSDADVHTEEDIPKNTGRFWFNCS